MQRLIDDANAYAEANGKAAGLSIDSFADIVQAIQYVQEAQHIAGTTAEEAGSTISGSVAQAKAAWDNLLTELGKPDADIGARIDELMVSLFGDGGDNLGVVGNVLPRIVQIASNVFDALPQVIEKAKPYIDELMTKAGTFIEQHKSEIEAASQVAFDGIKAGITIALKAAIQAVGEAIATIIATFPEWFPQLLAAAGELFLAILQGFAEGIEPAMNQLNEFVEGGVNVLVGAVSDFVRGGVEIINGIGEGIASGVDSVVSTVGDFVGNIASTFMSVVDMVASVPGRITGLFKGIGSKVASFFRSIPDSVNTIFNNVVDNVKAIPGKIVDFFSGLGDKITSAIGSIHFPQPHVSWDSVKVGSASIPIPHISWSAEGGLFAPNNPALLGLGDNRKYDEVAMPLSPRVLSQVGAGIAAAMGGSSLGGGITINLNYNASDDANDMLRDITGGIRQLRAAGAI